VTARLQRRLQRSAHLLAAAILLAYVYVPIGSQLEDAVRFTAFPLLALSGMAMWQAPRIRRAARTIRRRLR
jgi:hypothetical protein